MAFLRAINLGARRRFAMDDLVRVTTGAGFADVATHLATGNVRVATRLRSPGRVAEVLEAAYLDDRGFAVPVVVLAPDELRGIVADAAEVRRLLPGEWPGRSYVSLLREEPDAGGVAALEACSTEDELVRVRGRAAHLLVRGYGTSRLTNVAVERHVGVATNRALTVLDTLVGRWC